MLYVFEFCEINAFKSISETFQMSTVLALVICVLSICLFDRMDILLTWLKRGFHHFSLINHIQHLLLMIGLKHRQVTFVLLIVSLGFIALGIIGREWKIGVLILVAFSIASVLTYFLWRKVDSKLYAKIKKPWFPNWLFCFFLIVLKLFVR